VTVLEFSEFIGVLVSCCPAVPYAMLYTKVFEREKYLALKRHKSYEAKITISQQVVEDIEWWEKTLPSSYKSIRSDSYELEIFSDASKTGWGIACEKQKSHGWWSTAEAKEPLNINILELKAAYYGLKCYTSNMLGSQILLRVDNTTAISYINRMGGVQYPDYNTLARKIWQFCEKRKLWIFASYITSKDNFIADAESRKQDTQTEWELNSTTFDKIVSHFGLPEIDLFASSQNNKCKKFISWRPDPHSIAIDAFTVSWKHTFFYAFPPFSLILRMIQKIKTESARGIVVVPFWPNQPWFPVCMELAEKHIFIGPSENLLSLPNRKHPLRKTLTLVAMVLSARRL